MYLSTYNICLLQCKCKWPPKSTSLYYRHPPCIIASYNIAERFALSYIYFVIFSTVARHESGRLAQGLSRSSPSATAKSLSFLPGIVGLGIAQRTFGRRVSSPTAFVTTVAAPDHGRGHRYRSVRVPTMQRSFRQSRPT